MENHDAKPDLSPFERLKRFARAIIAVPKAEIAEKEAEYRRNRAKKKQKASRCLPTFEPQCSGHCEQLPESLLGEFGLIVHC